MTPAIQPFSRQQKKIIDNNGAKMLRQGFSGLSADDQGKACCWKWFVVSWFDICRWKQCLYDLQFYCGRHCKVKRNSTLSGQSGHLVGLEISIQMVSQNMAALAAQIYFEINLYRIIKLTSMSAFNYIFVPNLSFPSFYYISLPSNQALEPPFVQTQPQIPSLTDLLPPPPSARLELSQSDLLAAGYQRKKRVWSAEEDQKLLELINVQNISWKEIDKYMPQRTEKMCYSRYRRLIAQARHRWAPEDEKKLRDLVQHRGQSWKEFVNEFANRTWKQLRDKYVNYLRPDINKKEWSLEQDKKILELMTIHGTRWKSIQQEMTNRTDNQIKNRYYGRLKILLKRKSKRRARNSH